MFNPNSKTDKGNYALITDTIQDILQHAFKFNIGIALTSHHWTLASTGGHMRDNVRFRISHHTEIGQMSLITDYHDTAELKRLTTPPLTKGETLIKVANGDLQRVRIPYVERKDLEQVGTVLCKGSCVSTTCPDVSMLANRRGRAKLQSCGESLTPRVLCRPACCRYQSDHHLP
jgi:hypothetical protein